MTRHWRKGLAALVVAGVLIGALTGWRHYQDKKSQEHRAMHPILQNRQTYCLGRFLVDLPHGSELKAAISSTDASFSLEWGVTKSEFERRIRDRWTELQAMTEDIFGDAYVEPSKRIDVSETGIVFLYAHVILDIGPVDQRSDKPHFKKEGYLWNDGFLYKFDSGRVEDIMRTMQTLQRRDIETFPTGPGLCAAGSFFPGDEYGESVAFTFELPGAEQKYFFRFDTRTVWGEEARALSRRNTPDQAAAWLPTLGIEPNLQRNRNRIVAGMEGREWVSTFIAEKNSGYEIDLDGQWEFSGDIRSNSRPHMMLTYGFIYWDEKKPEKDGFFDTPAGREARDEYLALWDGILDSIRLRVPEGG